MLLEKLHLKAFDLTTPDGKITKISPIEQTFRNCEILIENIPSFFVGFSLDKQDIIFNLKSTLGQLGIDAFLQDFELDENRRRAHCSVQLVAIDPLGKSFLELIEKGSFIGKLFAKDERRIVKNPDYLTRMFGRSDEKGDPLLAFGHPENLQFEKESTRIIAHLPLLPHSYTYKEEIFGLLPTVAKALKNPQLSLRELLRFHQVQTPNQKRSVEKNRCLIVRTEPLHIRTVFARVSDNLPKGFSHLSSSILQPNTEASGDIYEFSGESSEELTSIPLEFYTLEPYKEHVFFSDRDQLQEAIENQEHLFTAISTSPKPSHHRAATFVVKNEQLKNLDATSWISIDAERKDFPGLSDLHLQRELVDRYIQQQPSYPFLKAIQNGLITSEGILLTRHFPSPVMKRMFLSEKVQRMLKGLYFEIPSLTNGEFFSHEDRAFLFDLSKFGIPVYWIDKSAKKILQYTPKPGKDSGLFVPLNRIPYFVNATLVGIYGSIFADEEFSTELYTLLKGLKAMRKEFTHPLLNPKTPLALVTGGGPGAMKIGNRVAKQAGILSCANIVDFSKGTPAGLAEQEQNPYIEAKMTYRLDRLVERQAEFHLDLPIILEGGIGSDFELALEEARRKTGVCDPTPILLFGEPNYWKNKITSRFNQNLTSGTIKGSEWISNCFYCIENAIEGLHVYQKYFSGQLPIGPEGPSYPHGFAIAKNL
ncbi:MAG: LOG family protein [Candidatus Algichlamydia australiensis]|nr:LOG family protein [Chlamydiales bacterium]